MDYRGGFENLNGSLKLIIGELFERVARIRKFYPEEMEKLSLN